MTAAKRATIVVVLAMAVMAGGCSSAPATGTVVSKAHESAERKCAKYTGTGRKRRCAQWKTEPEEWELTIRTADGHEVEVDVDRDTFDQYDEGDHYPKEK